MKSTGILVNKEQLRSNYKLTFKNKFSDNKQDLNVFLHGEQKAIFTNLRIGCIYFFFWFKSKKGYYYLNHLSIKENLQTSFKPLSEINARSIFVNQVSQELKLKHPNAESIKQKLEKVIRKVGIIKNQDHKKILAWTLELLRTLFIKHRGLSLMLDTPENNQEKELLQEIETLLTIDNYF